MGEPRIGICRRLPLKRKSDYYAHFAKLSAVIVSSVRKGLIKSAALSALLSARLGAAFQHNPLTNKPVKSPPQPRKATFGKPTIPCAGCVIPHSVIGHLHVPTALASELCRLNQTFLSGLLVFAERWNAHRGGQQVVLCMNSECVASRAQTFAGWLRQSS